MKFSTVPPVARYEFPLSRMKVAGYFLMIGFLIVILFSRGLEGQFTTGETGAVAVMALLLSAYMAFVLVPYFRHKGSIVRVTPEGLVDLRKSPDPLPWEMIKFADVKRLMIGPGLRIELTDGNRYDVDFHLLDGRAEQCFIAMREYLYASHPDEDGEDGEGGEEGGEGSKDGTAAR